MKLSRRATQEGVSLERGAGQGLVEGSVEGWCSGASSRLFVDQLGKCFVLKAAKPSSGTTTDVGTAPTREVWALRDVSFSVESGTVLGVIGPNGAGKTTLLRILARISLPSAGRVIGRGRVVSLLGMGMAMDADLTGRENVLLEATLHRFPRADAIRRMDRIVEFAELGAFIDAPMRHYSSGMFMRLAFAVAIHMEPDLLLADEVLAVGDAAFQDRCLDRVKEAQRSGLSVVFVSHDMVAIRRISDRVLWLEAGRVAGLGPPDEIIDRYLRNTRAPSIPARTAGRSNEEGAILDTEILKDDRPVGEVGMSDHFGVRVRIVVRSPVVRKARFAISLVVGAIHVLRSIQPAPLAVSVPGIYAATVWIPPHLLADTTYDVRVKVILSGGGAVSQLVQDNALLLRVVDLTGTVDAKGLVAPRLEWTSEAPSAAFSRSS